MWFIHIKIHHLDAGEWYEVKENYTQEEVDALVARSPYYKATANDIDWLQKVRMQGRIQRWVDHSISVTINLPSDVSEEMVGQLYVEAWRSGCKGCTVYRDGFPVGSSHLCQERGKETRCGYQ